MSKWLSRALIAAPFYYKLVLTEKQWKRELKKLGSEYFEAFPNGSVACCNYFYEENPGTLLVSLRNYETVEETVVYGLLVHEAVHIWQHTHKFYNEKEPSIEFEAYSIQKISQELIESYIEQRFKGCEQWS
jgi:hypothetical protein